jgi:hypothetical protein
MITLSWSLRPVNEAAVNIPKQKFKLIIIKKTLMILWCIFDFDDIVSVLIASPFYKVSC